MLIHVNPQCITYLEYFSFFTNSSRVRALCDVATDSGAFVERSVEAMAQATKGCELAIQTSNPNKMVEHASKLGRLANRVIHVARQETENSEDPAYIARLNVAVERVHRGKTLRFKSHLKFSIFQKGPNYLKKTAL